MRLIKFAAPTTSAGLFVLDVLTILLSGRWCCGSGAAPWCS